MDLDIKRKTINSKKYLFKYYNKGGKEITNKEKIKYFKSLVIPPAWYDVIICSNPNEKILAIGTDARGRRQYRYNKKYIELQENNKYKERMIDFITELPYIRGGIQESLSKRSWNCDKVTALVIHTIDNSHLRIGNDKYVKANDSYGITTLKGGHVDIKNNKIILNFIGKKGVENYSEITNPYTIKVFKNYYNEFQPKKNDDFFRYYGGHSGDELYKINSIQINDYIKEYGDFTIKDFRTYSANEMLLKYFYNLYKNNDGLKDISQSKIKQGGNKCLDKISENLNNTRAICKKSYCSDYLIGGFNKNPEEFITKMKKYMKKKKNPYSGLQTALLYFFKEIK